MKTEHTKLKYHRRLHPPISPVPASVAGEAGTLFESCSHTSWRPQVPTEWRTSERQIVRAGLFPRTVRVLAKVADRIPSTSVVLVRSSELWSLA